jgi:hypothetical protein
VAVVRGLNEWKRPFASRPSIRSPLRNRRLTICTLRSGHGTHAHANRVVAFGNPAGLVHRHGSSRTNRIRIGFARGTAVYEDIRATRNTDYVNNFWKVLANDPAALARAWATVKQVMAPGALSFAITALANATNRIANGYRVDVDERFK